MKLEAQRADYSQGRRKILASAALSLVVPAARAQPAWRATKPIKIIVPFAAGGGADQAARLVSKGLSERLGQPVTVENLVGASGSFGTEQVYGAPADGTVLLAATGDAQAVNPHLHPSSVDSLRFVPLAGITLAGFVLMGSPTLPAKTLTDLKTLAASRVLRYSSAGPGTAIHVISGAFGVAANIKNLLHVPYQGGNPALAALLSGEVDLMMVPGSIARPNLQKGVVYGITGLKRNRFMQEVPNFIEQGIPLIADSWTGIVAPPGTPAHIASTLAQAIYETVNAPEMQKTFTEQGREWFQLDRLRFADYYTRQYHSWGQLVKAAKIKI